MGSQIFYFRKKLCEMQLTVAGCDMASERTCSPQTVTETRWDAPATTLRWVKSPGLTNSSHTIDSSYDNSPSRHRLENKPS